MFFCFPHFKKIEPEKNMNICSVCKKEIICKKKEMIDKNKIRKNKNGYWSPGSKVMGGTEGGNDN